MPGSDGVTLRAWRRSHRWDVPELARQLRRASAKAGVQIAAHDGLIRMIYAWERGDHEVSERYELLYRALGVAPDLPVCSDDLAQCEAAPVARSTVPRSRLETLSAGQLEELIGLLDDQWHALVRTDNLLGPRHALGGVRDQLGVIDTLLRSVRPPVRHRVLELGAKYAESAAWLHEDSGDMKGARYWTGRSMEWALEAGDRLMMCWVLFRRGEHAAADGDAAAVAGLATAARREGKDLPGPMLAAVLQQEAHAYALDGDEAACQAALDQAHGQAPHQMTAVTRPTGTARSARPPTWRCSEAGAGSCSASPRKPGPRWTARSGRCRLCTDAIAVSLSVPWPLRSPPSASPARQQRRRRRPWPSRVTPGRKESSAW
jgi:hypothetical protein